MKKKVIVIVSVILAVIGIAVSVIVNRNKNKNETNGMVPLITKVEIVEIKQNEFTAKVTETNSYYKKGSILTLQIDESNKFEVTVGEIIDVVSYDFTGNKQIHIVSIQK